MNHELTYTYTEEQLAIIPIYNRIIRQACIHKQLYIYKERNNMSQEHEQCMSHILT